MLKKNEEYTVEITGAGSEGEGVCRIDGFAVFVPFALIGEQVKIRIVKALKNYAFGKLIQIVTPSPMRREPACPHFYQCGGCSLMHMDYEMELDFKRQKVFDALSRIGGIEAPEVQKTVPSPETHHYRNKVQFPVTVDGIGFYSPRSHNVINIESCIVQDSGVKQIVDAVREYMAEYGVKPYNEATHTGDIRHIFIRTARQTGERLVCLVTRNEKLPHIDKLIETISCTGLVQNINSKKTNVILGDKNILLWGSERIKEILGGITFMISPQSFFQINLPQTEALYAKAAALAGLTGAETVYDLYCGIGTISLYLAKYCKKVVGVESIPAAVGDARDNARINNILNAEFHLGAAEDVVPLLNKSMKADVVVIDPPRKGCDSHLLDAIKSIKPQKIIYISCNPATLARDIALLDGYKISHVQPFDMFPRTPHVETVVLLSKLKSSDSIEVKIDLDEMDLTTAESKATYDEIKWYVLD